MFKAYLDDFYFILNVHVESEKGQYNNKKSRILQFKFSEKTKANASKKGRKLNNGNNGTRIRMRIIKALWKQAAGKGIELKPDVGKLGKEIEKNRRLKMKS